MAQLLTPICDRCGQRGPEGHSFAQIKFISSQGTVKVLDLCWKCEAEAREWIAGDSTKADESNTKDKT